MLILPRLINKIIICSSDSDNVKIKIMVGGVDPMSYKNLIICEKPLKLDIIKNVIQDDFFEIYDD
jgi:hypothetical protein